MSELAHYDYPADAAPHPTGHPAHKGLAFRLTLILAFAGLMIARQVLWRIHFPVPQHYISIGMSVGLAALMGLFALYVYRTQAPVPPRHGFNGRLAIFAGWVSLLIAWGFVRDNIPNVIFKEAIVFAVFLLLMFVGRYDAVWRAVEKPLVVTFYVGFVLVMATYRIPGVITTFEGSAEAETKWVPRNLDTIGYSLRGILAVGLLLTAWGLARRQKDRWRLLMLGTLPLYCFVHILLFEFRGSVILVLTLLGSYAILLPVVRRQIPVRTLIVVAVVGALGFAVASRTQSYANLMKRFAREQVFTTRIDENTAFFREMDALDLVVGRGMGGWYRGPLWAKGILYHGQWRWNSNHFGFLGFVLRGGFLLLLFVMTFVIPYALPKPPAWYEDEYNLAAFLLAPVLILNIILNPILFTPDAFFDMLMAGFCLARFSTPVTDTDLWPATEPTQPDGYAY